MYPETESPGIGPPATSQTRGLALALAVSLWLYGMTGAPRNWLIAVGVPSNQAEKGALNKKNTTRQFGWKAWKVRGAEATPARLPWTPSRFGSAWASGARNSLRALCIQPKATESVSFRMARIGWVPEGATEHGAPKGSRNRRSAGFRRGSKVSGAEGSGFRAPPVGRVVLGFRGSESFSHLSA